MTECKHSIMSQIERDRDPISVIAFNAKWEIILNKVTVEEEYVVAFLSKIFGNIMINEYPFTSKEMQNYGNLKLK